MEASEVRFFLSIFGGIGLSVLSLSCPASEDERRNRMEEKKNMDDTSGKTSLLGWSFLADGHRLANPGGLPLWGA